MRDKLI